MQVDLSSFRFSSPLGKAIFAAISVFLILIISGFIFSHKEVSLEIDGKAGRLVTKAGTVADLLVEQNVRISSHDQIRPGKGTGLVSGSKIVIKHARPVVLEINGKSRKIWTVAKTVSQVVEGLGIDTGADIKLEPAQETAVTAGLTIRLKLLNRWIERVQAEIPYGVKREDDGKLPKGRTRMAIKGKPGIKETVIEHVMAGGQEIERIVRSEAVLAGPVTEVVKVGTRVQRAVAAASGPGINVSRGGRSLVMSASAYASGTGGAGWRTATGTGVHHGIVAVDPRLIPLGSRLFIEGYGQAVAADTGGAIKGNRIDLGFGSASEALRFGRRTVVVHILN